MASKLRIALLLTLLLTAVPAVAATYWQAGTGNWSYSPNWTGGEPVPGEYTNISNGGTAQVTAVNTETCGQLDMAAGDVASGYVEQTGGEMRITYDVAKLRMGVTEGGISGYTISGDPSARLYVGTAYIGYTSTGELTQYTGQAQFSSNLYLGYDTGGAGTYTLEAAGE